MDLPMDFSSTYEFFFSKNDFHSRLCLHLLGLCLGMHEAHKWGFPKMYDS